MIENFKKEIWKDIEGYEGLYQISNMGRVKSLGRIVNSGRNESTFSYMIKERILNPIRNNENYLYVKLRKEGKYKQYFIHRLVAMAYIPNPNNYPCVNHKNEDPSFNVVKNLEWCTHKYNNNYGTRGERISKAKMGHPVSEETRKKISEKNKNKHHPNRKIPIVQIDRNGNVTHWESAWDVNKAWNKKVNNNITKCLKGEIQFAYGYKWMYLDEYNKRAS